MQRKVCEKRAHQTAAASCSTACDKEIFLSFAKASIFLRVDGDMETRGQCAFPFIFVLSYFVWSD